MQHPTYRCVATTNYEYVRSGTCNVFVAVEPRGGRRVTQVTDHRGKEDFVAFVQRLVGIVYRSARRIHLVVDNLNTHFQKCFTHAGTQAMCPGQQARAYLCSPPCKTPATRMNAHFFRIFGAPIPVESVMRETDF